MDKQERSEWRVASIAFAVGFAVFLGFAVWGDFGRGRAGLIAIGAIVSAVSGVWDQRRKLWFWVILCFVVAAHAVAVIEFSWSDRQLNYWQLLPFGFADVLVIYGVFKLAQRMARSFERC